MWWTGEGRVGSNGHLGLGWDGEGGGRLGELTVLQSDHWLACP